MANKVRVRVELNKEGVDMSDERDRWSAFRKMLIEYRKARQRAGIEQTLKEHQVYETPNRKRRRKGREAEIARLKEKLRDNFLEGKKTNG